jgi:regulator of sigma E protease
MDIMAAFGGFAWAALFFVIALSIIIFVHEYGHYIIGRWSGIHAEVFSLGFGPVLFSRVDSRGTKWQLAAVPFGGFVKFMGDKDATSVRQEDAPGLSETERRRTMAGAPLWARTATVAAGPVFNFILTFVVLAGILLAGGIAVDEPTVKRLIPTPFEGATLEPGDVILAINDKPTPSYETLNKVSETLDDATVDYRIRRNGTEMVVPGPHPEPAVAVSVQLQSAAMDAGLQAGDVILSANGREVAKFSQLPDIVASAAGKPVLLKVWREGKTFEVSLSPRRRDLPKPEGGFEQRWLIGLTGGLVFDPATRAPGVLETLSLSGQQMWSMTTGTFSGIWHLITGQISTCNMSGPIGMAETMGDAATEGADTFFLMLAVLSLGVGILNLFPIPVLDGGHLVFFAYEAVIGRPPSDRALKVLMSIGLTLILGLMIFSLTNDIVCV